MLFRLFTLFIVIWFFGVGCAKNSTPSPADIRIPPQVQPADKKFHNVYRMLDGEWRGQFLIYENKTGQPDGSAWPESFNADFAARPELSLKMKLEVRQVYRSVSPYFQRVQIWDTYQKKNGETATVHSTGANKVQDGELWCVVNKPDETVIHSGTLPSADTIIWRRDVRSPQLKVEYFKETVKKDTYSIRGWGYYASDDPDKAPRLWFSADYKRVTH